MSWNPVYLDFNATTPVDETVFETMAPWFREAFWNAASSHALGRRAASAVDRAREQLAELVGARPQDIVWTSGATEANNLALKGAFEARQQGRNRVLVGATEHKAVLDVAEWLASSGAEVSIIPVTADGQVDLAAFDELLDDRVAAVSVMAANNETGVLAPIGALAAMAHQAGALFHTDATQAAGRLAIDLRNWDVDLASFSAHKVYGPKGVGALYAPRRNSIAPVMHGGGHERGLRSGTLNVPGIVGFGAVAAVSRDRLDDDIRRYGYLAERLHEALSRGLSGVELIAAPAPRLSNTANIRFVGADGDAVMANAPRIAVSSGSACTSSVPSASHVLRAMGMAETEALECLRFSVGRPTTDEDIDLAAAEITHAVERVREMSR